MKIVIFGATGMVGQGVLRELVSSAGSRLRFAVSHLAGKRQPGEGGARNYSSRLEFFEQIANNLIGMNHADHAALLVDHGQRVQVVFVE